MSRYALCDVADLCFSSCITGLGKYLSVGYTDPVGLEDLRKPFRSSTWVVVKIMVPFWVPIIIRHVIFRVPKKGPSF